MQILPQAMTALNSHISSLKLAALFFALVCGALNSSYAQSTWDGGGVNNNWSDPLNWNGPNVAPVNGAALSFPSGAPGNSKSNNNDLLSSVTSLNFDGNQNYTITGNALSFSGGLAPKVIATGTANHTINLNLGLASGETNQFRSGPRNFLSVKVVSDFC